MALHSELSIYAPTRDLSKLISQVVANMQRDFKFTLGKRLDDQCFDLAMDIYRANSSDNRVQIIQGMREKVVAIELSMRLALDLKRMAPKQYARGIQLTNNIGKQLTGWKKSSETRQMPNRQGGRVSAHR